MTTRKIITSIFGRLIIGTFFLLFATYSDCLSSKYGKCIEMSLLDRQVIAIAALIFLLSIIPLLLSLRRDKAHYRNALRSAFNIGPYKGPPIPNTRSSLYALWVVTLEFAAFSMISIYQSIKIIKGGAFNEPLIYNIFTALFLLVGFLPGGLVMFLIIRIIKIMRRH